MAMVACGWRHTRCVSSSGGLYTTGWGKYGQLGHGNFEDHLVPRKVQALSDKFISQVGGGIVWHSRLVENFWAGDEIRLAILFILLLFS
ncbi:hypothetical protein AAZV13_08G001450 [Glycine max]